MEILFFSIVFVCLYLYERTRTLQPAQWTTKIMAIPEIEVSWEQYDTPTYQRRGVHIANPAPVQVEAKSGNKRRSRSRQ